jgi:hypothetical protein
VHHHERATEFVMQVVRIGRRSSWQPLRQAGPGEEATVRCGNRDAAAAAISSSHTVIATKNAGEARAEARQELRAKNSGGAGVVSAGLHALCEFLRVRNAGEAKASHCWSRNVFPPLTN